MSSNPPPSWDGVKWEYKALTVEQPVAAYMNELGEQGWELVTAYPPPGSKKDGLYCVFKRSKVG